ncbi:MAG TPA: L-seryl-tRNA(Sec) selenium transferase, partial [Telluria sp.]
PLQHAVGTSYLVAAEPMLSQIGSGALPVDRLPSFGLAIRAASGVRGNPLGVLERRLRGLPRPVIGRIADDTLWLDLRCLEQEQSVVFVEQLAKLPA